MNCFSNAYYKDYANITNNYENDCLVKVWEKLTFRIVKRLSYYLLLKNPLFSKAVVQ